MDAESHRQTGQDARKQNLTLALRIAYAAGATSRADIARGTGLTRATASDIVRELTEAGFLVEVGTGESTGGKPPTLLEFQADARNIITLDLSTQPFRGAVHDLRGTVLQRRSLRATGLVGSAAVAKVLKLTQKLLADATSPIAGIGIGAPGLIDANGVVMRSTNLGWEDVALAETIAAGTGIPTHVANDTSVAALAEFAHFEDGTANMMLVEIADGIGAGIVLNGSIHLGETAAAGEIGHLVTVPGGNHCTCGKRGCLETVASVPSLLRISGVDTVAELGTGDGSALGEAAGHLGRILATAVAVLDVHRIVLAGPLGELDTTFTDTVRHLIQSRVLTQVADDVTVTWTKMGHDIVLAGAAIHVMRSELGLPW